MYHREEIKAQKLLAAEKILRQRLSTQPLKTSALSNKSQRTASVHLPCSRQSPLYLAGSVTATATTIIPMHVRMPYGRAPLRKIQPRRLELPPLRLCPSFCSSIHHSILPSLLPFPTSALFSMLARLQYLCKQIPGSFSLRRLGLVPCYLAHGCI